VIPGENEPVHGSGRRRRLVIWAVALGVPLLALVVVAAVFLASLGSIDQSRPETVARGYLDALIAHEPEKAYAVLCPEQRETLSEEQWADRILMVDKYDFVDVHPDPASGDSRATVDVGVNDATGRKVQHQLTVVKESGRWWVCDQ
jgi:hypothetical protein